MDSWQALRAVIAASLSRSLFFWYSSFLALLVVTAAIPVAISYWLASGGELYQAFGVSLFLFCLIAAPFAILLTLKRFHDFGLSEWWLLAYFAIGPFYNIMRQTRSGIALLIGLINMAIPLVVMA